MSDFEIVVQMYGKARHEVLTVIDRCTELAAEVGTLKRSLEVANEEYFDDLKRVRAEVVILRKLLRPGSADIDDDSLDALIEQEYKNDNSSK